MKCPAARELIEAYVDGELDASQKSEVRGHLEGCITCAETHWQLQEMRTNLRREAPRYEAPEYLAQRISRRLRQEAGRSAGGRAVPWKWIAIAACVLLAVSAVVNVRTLSSRRGAGDLIASDVVSSHVRSLVENHLLDVPSTDQHTVKPWFNGKVDYAPVVKDLAAQGYPLVGGRVDYIAEQPAAVMVYRRRQHVINLFTWPVESNGRNEELHRRGFNLIAWTSGGMNYWAVSDLNAGELRDFVRLLDLR